MNTLDFIIKKYALNLNRRLPIEIPDLGRSELAKLFCELGFTKGVEVGVLLGRYSKELCDANPKLKLWGIDPWMTYPEFIRSETQETYESYYQEAKKTVPPNCILIRQKSMDAINNFKDNSIDFVYIDGNHEFTSEANDIHEWSKKVHPGGIISGHDYRRYQQSSFSHSYEVVKAYTRAYRINPWFIIGANNDKIKSWFWIKN